MSADSWRRSRGPVSVAERTPTGVGESEAGMGRRLLGFLRRRRDLGWGRPVHLCGTASDRAEPPSPRRPFGAPSAPRARPARKEPPHAAPRVVDRVRRLDQRRTRGARLGGGRPTGCRRSVPRDRFRRSSGGEAAVMPSGARAPEPEDSFKGSFESPLEDSLVDRLVGGAAQPRGIAVAGSSPPPAGVSTAPVGVSSAVSAALGLGAPSETPVPSAVVAAPSTVMAGPPTVVTEAPSARAVTSAISPARSKDAAPVPPQSATLRRHLRTPVVRTPPLPGAPRSCRRHTRRWSAWRCPRSRSPRSKGS